MNECAPSDLIGQEFGVFSPVRFAPVCVAYSAMQHKGGCRIIRLARIGRVASRSLPTNESFSQ